MKVLLALLLISSPVFADEAKTKYESVCASCHGKDGKTTNTDRTPRLAGQKAA